MEIGNWKEETGNWIPETWKLGNFGNGYDSFDSFDSFFIQRWKLKILWKYADGWVAAGWLEVKVRFEILV